MTINSLFYKQTQQAIGSPEDPIATDTTTEWSSISLLKSIASKLGVGGAFTFATDVAQGSTTLGQTGGLTQAAVTTAAPSYTTAKTNPLSLKTNGDLRVADTDVATLLTAIAASVDGLEGSTDGLETLVTSTNTKLDTAIGHLDGVEGLLAAATPAGTNLIGRAVADASAATGGIASTSRILSAAASTNATSAKGSAGRVYAIQGANVATTARYLKLYNKASAPTVGTDTPVKTIYLPASSAFAFDFPLGYSFATGIAYALTTGSADADTGALTAGDVLALNVDYS